MSSGGNTRGLFSLPTNVELLELILLWKGYELLQ